MLLPILLSTIDLCSDVLFIRRLSESHFHAGKDFMHLALFVLTTSIGMNFFSFFAIFVHANNMGKVNPPTPSVCVCVCVCVCVRVCVRVFERE